MAGWKTNLFNLIAIVVAVAGYFGFSQHTPSDWAQQVINAVPFVVPGIVALVNLVLRQFTKSESGLVKALKSK